MKYLFFAAIIAILYFYGKRWLASSSPMSVSDAAKLLDVATNAEPETILAAHRRLIAKVHPDAGGSADLAARVNQARDVLLKHPPG